MAHTMSRGNKQLVTTKEMPKTSQICPRNYFENLTYDKKNKTLINQLEYGRGNDKRNNTPNLQYKNMSNPPGLYPIFKQ